MVGVCGVGNEKGDVRGAAGILSVIKCRKGAHDDNDGRGARPEYNERARDGHCGNIVTFRGDKFNRKHCHFGRGC